MSELYATASIPANETRPIDEEKSDVRDSDRGPVCARRDGPSWMHPGSETDPSSSQSGIVNRQQRPVHAARVAYLRDREPSAAISPDL
jgi:hypothetical protein